MDAPWTEYYNTPNKSVRQNVARRGVVLHHAAMLNLNELIRLEMGAKQVSSTATCKDARLPLMMPLDTWRPWSLSDAYWDSALRSVETCNETIAGWTVSDASHWSLARAVAYWATIDGFWPHRDGDQKTWTVLGHREVYTIHGGSYGTACPGGMNIDLVVQRAQGILRGENGFLMALTDEQQQNMYEWVRQGPYGWFPNLVAQIGDVQARLASGFGYDWLPAIANQGNQILSALEAIAEDQGVELDETTVAKIGDQVTAALKAGIEATVRNAVLEAIPDDAESLTKQDVIDIFSRITIEPEVTE